VVQQRSLPKHVQAFFSNQTYPHPVSPIEMIETHISWVFLTGEYAYKLKKPVRFDFLDFSTLKKRKYYCEQELHLNQRLSQAIYLDVLPVYEQKNGSYSLVGEAGNVVDYCLKMKQFNQDSLFDELIAKGKLLPDWMDSLAKDVANFHQLAEINEDIELNHIGLLTEHIQANFAIATAHAGKVITQKKVTTLLNFAKKELHENFNNLKQRQEKGHIRDCHGDLHLRNITLFHHKPLVFDCIEFNDEFRMIDTMNDVAFLVMDCEAHTRPDLGFRFLSRYLEHCADYEGLKLLPLYLFYRASVRGKVGCLLADEQSEPKRQQQLDEAAKYFELTAHYALKKKPKLIVIGGLSGSGKSHLSLLACGQERAVIIRSDATRKRIHAVHADLSLYGEEMHEYTYQAMLETAKVSLNAGFSAILDATFLSTKSRQQVAKFAHQQGIDLLFFWLDICEKMLRERIHQRMKLNDDISDADLEILELQLAGYEKPKEPWIQFLYSSHAWKPDKP